MFSRRRPGNASLSLDRIRESCECRPELGESHLLRTRACFGDGENAAPTCKEPAPASKGEKRQKLTKPLGLLGLFKQYRRCSF